MSYKDKPQIKLYKFENSAFVLQAFIDDFQEISFEHNLYQAGIFTITINYNIPNALLFQRGLFVQIGPNPYDFGEIYAIKDSIGSDGKGSQIRTITGYDARYILKRRVIKNMNSNGLWVMTAKGELCLRNLIKDQCGSGAETKRQLPINNVIPASADAIGKEYSVSENFSNLYEVCKTIATQSEIGWRIAFENGSLNLEVYAGQDLSQTVRFDTNYESLANGEFSDSSESFSNAIYIGGKGQNDNRDIYEGEEGTPSGFDRFESWDNQSQMTTESEYEAEALSMLSQYGQTLTMQGNGLAKCPYIFREQYDIGDIITVAFSGKSATAQILSVTEHWAWGSYDIQFSFGKPQNNLAEQLQLMLRQIQKASEKASSTDSVRWYTIPTDTAMPKADVTYNTIGFVGDVGSGATFTLYLDNEKTGAKTYHVWFKQLAGNGKLTLTTGKSGAVDLSFGGGTYVAIISVDENGNIVNVASTPTDIISSGNNQPATSGGVADAIQGVISLPTDAVLHYSFDELPDYPDGTADVRLLDNNTYDIQSGNYQFRNSGGTTFSNNNGKIQFVTSGDSWWNGAYIQYQYTNNKILKIKFSITSLESGTLYLYTRDSNSDVLSFNKVGTYEVCFNSITAESTTVVSFVYRTAGKSVTVVLDKIYIGDGSYSTPIIDNANGQWNSVSQSGVAVKGVSGKGMKHFAGQGVIENGFKLNDNFTISFWINPENDLGGIQGETIRTSEIIIRNGATWGNYAMLYLWGENGTLIDSAGLGALFSPNTWTHVVIIKNELNVYYYKNGEFTNNWNLTSSNLATTAGQLIVNLSDRPQSVDDLLIFDRALTENEVMALYLNKANTPKYYTKADWKLEQMENANRSVRTIEEPPIEESGEEER